MGERIFRDLLTILEQAAEVADDSVTGHFASFLDRSAVSHNARQRPHDDLVAAFGEGFVKHRIAIFGHRRLPF